MTLTATLKQKGTVAIITLAGVLDALTAPMFRAELERAAERTIEQLVLDLSQVNYLSSGGLRTLAYARQKLPPGTRIALVGANETVQRTIRLVGFHYSLEFSDRLPSWETGDDATI